MPVIRNKPEIAKYLIFKGADIQVLNANYKTPLDYITPEQEELLALFHPSANAMVTEKGGELNFEKMRL